MMFQVRVYNYSIILIDAARLRRESYRISTSICFFDGRILVCNGIWNLGKRLVSVGQLIDGRKG